MAKAAVTRPRLVEMAAAYTSIRKTWAHDLPQGLRELFEDYCRDINAGNAAHTNHSAAHRAFQAECINAKVKSPSRQSFVEEVNKRCESH